MWTKGHQKLVLTLWVFSSLNSVLACTKNDTIIYYAYECSVDPELVLAVIEAESSFCLDALSRVGAVGIIQFMPATAAGLGVDPVQNIYGDSKYLRQRCDQCKNWTRAVAAYNAGPQAVLEYAGVPPHKETCAYLLKVHSYHV
jgi:soluble lytic murein transglycosylase-like protein